MRLGLVFAVVVFPLLASGVELGFNPFQAVGYADVVLEKSVYQPGQSINFTIVLQNGDRVVFNDAVAVVDLVRETTVNGSKAVPLYFVSETVVRGMDVLQGGVGNFSGVFPLPNNLKSGDYALYFYFAEGRTPVLGNPLLFNPGLIKRFKIDSAFSGELFVLANSTIDGVMGQSGPVVNFSNITGTVSLKTAGRPSSDLRLKLSVFRWNDFEAPAVFTSTLPVGVVDGVATLSFKVPRPKLPGAYSLRYELLDAGVVKSFGRQRFVVPGPSARIVRLDVRSPSLAAGKEAGFQYAVVGSADDSLVNATVFLNVSIPGTGTVFSRVEQVELNESYFWWDELAFTPGVSAAEYAVSAKVVSGGVVLDEFTQNVVSAGFSNGPIVPNDLKVEVVGVQDGVPLVSGDSVFLFYSSTGQGLLCTSATIIAKNNDSSITLYAGNLSSGDRKSFTAFSTIPKGVYDVSVLCRNSFDLHASPLDASKKVCVRSCIATAPTPFIPPTFLPPAVESRPDMTLPVLMLALIVLLGAYYYVRKRGHAV